MHASQVFVWQRQRWGGDWSGPSIILFEVLTLSIGCVDSVGCGTKQASSEARIKAVSWFLFAPDSAGKMRSIGLGS